MAVLPLPVQVKETRRSLQDSRTGLQELTIGHHLDDRAHIVGRKRNRRTGDEDHSVHYVNLDEGAYMGVCGKATAQYAREACASERKMWKPFCRYAVS